MQIKLKNKVEIAKNTLLLEFDLEGQKISFKAGQNAAWILPNLKAEQPGANLHTFSIASAPEQTDIIQFAARISPSPFKQSLTTMPLGEEIVLGQIKGDLILPPLGTPIVWLAGGIGITPFVSMLRSIKIKRLDYQITLIYSNRDKQSTAFLAELQQLAKDLPNFKLILTMTDEVNWPGEKQIINAELIKKYVTDNNQPLYYVVGAPAMNQSIYDSLISLNIPTERIKTEDFTGY